MNSLKKTRNISDSNCKFKTDVETFKDFIDEFKARLSNPFFASFIIGWLVCNWPIVLALVFYKQDELVRDGYTSYLHFIKLHTGLWLNLILPAMIAILYTFVNPYFKAFIKVFNARIATSSEAQILKVTGEGSMPVAKYLELKSQYKHKTEEITELILNEASIKEENSELKNQIAKAENSINDLKTQNAILSTAREKAISYNNVSVMNGNWDVQIKLSSQVNEKFWSIVNSQIMEGELTRTSTYRIEKLICDAFSSRLSFVLVPTL